MKNSNDHIFQTNEHVIWLDMADESVTRIYEDLFIFFNKDLLIYLLVDITVFNDNRVQMIQVIYYMTWFNPCCSDVEPLLFWWRLEGMLM